MSVPRKGTKEFEKLKPSEQKELNTAALIKPKLQKFLIEQQRNAAHLKADALADQLRVATKNKEGRQRAAHLAVIAFLDKKLWIEKPLPIECGWIKGIDSKGNILSQSDKDRERNSDIAGFANFLFGEHEFMKGYITSLRYPEPFQEENLPFFWNKFISDLALLFRINKKIGAL